MKVKWLFKAFAVASVLIGKLPAIMEDGKVTGEEALDLLGSLFSVFDLPMAFDVPEDFKEAVIGAKLLE